MNDSDNWRAEKRKATWRSIWGGALVGAVVGALLGALFGFDVNFRTLQWVGLVTGAAILLSLMVVGVRK